MAATGSGRSDVAQRATVDAPVAFVTGAGSGIGRASALALARRGCVVVVADLDGDSASTTVQALEGLGGRGEALVVDVIDAGAVGAAIDSIVDRWGRLDLAHNNAGVFRSAASFVDTTDEE